MKNSFILATALCFTCQSAWALSESEPNGATFSANGPFSIPDTITGNCQNDGEALQDYYRFSSASGQKWRFVASVVNPSSFAPLDLRIGVANSGNSFLAVADVFGGNVSESLNFTAPSAGTYYLVVDEATAAPNAVASYSVAVSPQAAVSDWNLY